MSITFKQIADRWKWDGVCATRRRIRLAVKVTGNPYGITCGGVPYVRPKVGMRVKVSPSVLGTIVAVKPSRRDPQTVIDTDDGRRVYLYQTALYGYSVLGDEKKART